MQLCTLSHDLNLLPCYFSAVYISQRNSMQTPTPNCHIPILPYTSLYMYISTPTSFHPLSLFPFSLSHPLPLSLSTPSGHRQVRGSCSCSGKYGDKTRRTISGTVCCTLTSQPRCNYYYCLGRCFMHTITSLKASRLLKHFTKLVGVPAKCTV